MGVIRNKKAFLAFLLPGLLFYILAVFYPIEESIRLSFMKWGGIGKKQFVGLQNYVTMFHDEVFYKAFFNNLIYLVIVVSMQLLIGLFFAILLTYMTKHVTLVKTLYYVPCIITTVAIKMGVSADFFTPFKELSKFFIVLAMVAIGLNTNVIKLIKNGGKPIILGFICWICIACMSLFMQHLLGIW